jgi:hypothetical protein
MSHRVPTPLTPLLAAALLGLLGCGGSDSHFAYVSMGPPWITQSVAVADLNGDGKLDVVSANAVAGGKPGFVTVRLQDPANPGTYLDPVRSSAGPSPGALAVLTVAGSATPAVVVLNRQVTPAAQPANTVALLLADPALAGAFKAPVSLALGTRNPADLAVGDLNGDGLTDVAVAADGGNDVLVFFQAAGGTFGAPVPVTVAGVPTALAVADLNGDGAQDLVVVTSGGVLSVLLQDPAHKGAFLPRVDYPVGSGPVAVRVADLDGDGRPDLVVVNGGSALTATTKGLSLLLQNPAAPGTFLAAVTLDTGDSYASAVAIGDLNGDGRPDLVVANAGLPGLPGSLAVLLQDPAKAGTFLAPALYRGVYGPLGVAIADLDGDGLPDLLSADGGTFGRLQRPGQPGVFGPAVEFRQ